MRTLKPFDLEAAKAGAKVVTREGKSARIICWDAYNVSKDYGCSFPIVALIREGKEDNEYPFSFTSDGHYIPNNKACYDLFLLDESEPELTEFEEKLVTELMVATNVPRERVKIEAVKETAKELLYLAKQELALKGEIITLNNLPPYDAGFQDGRAEALKDLPRWKKAKSGKKFNGDTIVIPEGETEARLVRCAVNDCVYIQISDLEKLPKEE